MARTPPPRPNPGDPESDSDDPLDSDDQTDPREVIEPVAQLIHRNLSEIEWVVYSNHQMCFIFDVVTPGRQWKRGTVYGDEDPWAKYGRAPWPDLTETDEADEPQQPYYPMEHIRKYKFAFDDFKAEHFLHKNIGVLRKLQVGTLVKVRNKDEYKVNWKELRVPIIYVQLIAQLLAEDFHGDHNDGHEALRRQSYARRVLDEVGKEFLKCFKEWNRTRNFAGIRFRVLNPILQRYLRGVPDAYTPVVRASISGGDEPTIRDVTEFYLSKDPVDPTAISLYHRNLLYIPESRWHLAILMGKADLEDAGHFDKVRINHDNIMEALAADDGSSTAPGEESELVKVEVRAIFDEGLEYFFRVQLQRVPELVREIKAEMQERAGEQQEHTGDQDTDAEKQANEQQERTGDQEMNPEEQGEEQQEGTGDQEMDAEE